MKKIDNNPTQQLNLILKQTRRLLRVNNLADNKLQEEFTNMLIQFQDIKTNISDDLKYKH